MTPICPGSGYWPLPADRVPDRQARCPRCGAIVGLSKSRHILAHPAPDVPEEEAS